jgi:hypothetical protein
MTQKQCKRGRDYFGSQFPRVQFMVTGPHALGENIMMVGVCELLHLMTDKKQRKRRELGTRYNPKSLP